jgi:hypothetical protein
MWKLAALLVCSSLFGAGCGSTKPPELASCYRRLDGRLMTTLELERRASKSSGHMDTVNVSNAATSTAKVTDGEIEGNIVTLVFSNSGKTLAAVGTLHHDGLRLTFTTGENKTGEVNFDPCPS